MSRRRRGGAEPGLSGEFEENGERYHWSEKGAMITVTSATRAWSKTAHVGGAKGDRKRLEALAFHLVVGF